MQILVLYSFYILLIIRNYLPRYDAASNDTIFIKIKMPTFGIHKENFIFNLLLNKAFENRAKRFSINGTYFVTIIHLYMQKTCICQ